ncbi:MAG: glycogen/starch synthase [Anaerolineales bacterium]|nr:glycogen/starch synthase [Anaerolineales bacterium]
MKVLQLAAEATPLAKVGGLADVVGELPRALYQLGVDTRVMIPMHPTINRKALAITSTISFSVPRGKDSVQADVYETSLGGVAYYMIDGAPVRAGRQVYNDTAIDAEKYVFFSIAALLAAVAIDWKPDLLHAHDWHAAPGLLWLNSARARDPYWEDVQSLLTLHNLPYHGPGCEETFPAYGIESLQGEPIPEWAAWLPLPQAIAAADSLSTVSPTYAQEILTPEYASGLDELIRSRSDRMTGILNAIDFNLWDPAKDPKVPVHFDKTEISKRHGNKQLLQQELSLSPTDAPLIVMITRVDYQKGIDLALGGLEQLIDTDWQFVLLGVGTPDLEALASAFGRKHPDRVRIIQSFRPTLSHHMYAAADMLLMPSRYEPCGLAQLIGMRYGTVPIARATGGLKDTIIDHTSAQIGTGFLFESADADACAVAVRRALDVYQDRGTWKQVQARAMAHEFSWDHAARNYKLLYEKIQETHRDQHEQ